MNFEFKLKMQSQAEKFGYHKTEEAIDGMAFYNDFNRIAVIVSVDKEDDNKNWLHVSFSKSNKVPSYNDLMEIKNIFIGEDKKAIQIFPEKKYHVNIMPYCLHLFHCLDGDSLPEFSKEGRL